MPGTWGHLSHRVGLVAAVGHLPPCVAANGHDAVVVERGMGREVVLLDVLHVNTLLQSFQHMLEQFTERMSDNSGHIQAGVPTACPDACAATRQESMFLAHR